MAVLPTRLADVIVPDIFAPYVIERTAAQSKFVQSGIVQRVDEIKMAGGGKVIDMPFWKDLTGISEIVTSGGTASVGKITASLDRARRFLRQKGWGSEDIAGILAGSDPMRAIGDLVGDFWARDFQTTVISLLKGVFSAASMSGNVSDIAVTSGSPTTASKFTSLTFIAATQKMGDSRSKLKAVAMHSAVEAALLGNDDIDYIHDSDGKLVMTQYKGLNVVVDDSLPVETVAGNPVYTTYIFGEGAIAYAENTEPKPIDGGIGTWYQEMAREALQGLSLMVNRRDFVLHPRGVKFTDNSVAAETPTNAELEIGTNWERVYEAKNVRIVQFKHNI